MKKKKKTGKGKAKQSVRDTWDTTKILYMCGKGDIDGEERMGT